MAKDTATGLALRQNRLEWTTVRRVRNGYSIVASKKVPIEIESTQAVNWPEPDPAVLSAVSLQLRSKYDGAKDQTSVALPSGHALLKVIDLPTVDKDELKSMVDLQVDKYSPFPADSTASSYELLRQTDSSSKAGSDCSPMPANWPGAAAR